MFYIKNKKTGFFMCGYCMWTNKIDTALGFSTREGVGAVAHLLRRSGVSVEVIPDEA